jgi:hypothetical protein
LGEGKNAYGRLGVTVVEPLGPPIVPAGVGAKVGVGEVVVIVGPGSTVVVVDMPPQGSDIAGPQSPQGFIWAHSQGFGGQPPHGEPGWIGPQIGGAHAPHGDGASGEQFPGAIVANGDIVTGAGAQAGAGAQIGAGAQPGTVAGTG